VTQARYLVGDVFHALGTLPDDSVDLVMTSPPFLALRSYLPAEHPDKGKEIGSEATPADFLDTLLDVVEALDRVLAPHGSICFELGDTYAGSGGAGGDYNAEGLRAGQQKFSGSAAKRRREGVGDDYRPPRAGRGLGSAGGRTSRPDDVAAGLTHPRSRPGPESRDHVVGWPMDKSLCGIPTLFAWSLAYGRNLLRPERQTTPWRVRNVVAWCRPNPPVGALSDKFRPATSYLTIATRARDRYFDLDAVRTDPSDVKDRRHRTTNGPKQDADPSVVLTANYHQRIPSNPAGAPPLDYWVIPTQPYAGSHYATYPEALCERPIKAMCPLRVCISCGEPSRRIVDVEHVPNRSTNGPQSIERKWLDGGSAGYDQRADRVTTTVGWTCCGCCSTIDQTTHNTGDSYCGENEDHWRPGLVLDPFAGSGTTLAVATGHGREAIGIDLDERNAALALDRVGPLLLTVEHVGQRQAS